VQHTVHADAEFVGNFLSKAKRQLGALIDVEFTGKRQHDFACENSIAPTVMHFNAVPELLSVGHMPTSWQLNARIKHAVSTTVVEDQAGALIADQRTGTICRGSRRRAATGASDGCACAQMENGHTRSPEVSGRSPDRT
jgi:hypothetical protein